MSKKIVITGGAGFIGSHLTEVLSENYDVKVADNLSSGKKKFVSENIEFEKIDIRDKNKVIESFKDADKVFHFAANPKVNTFPEDKERDFSINLEGTKNVLDACINTGVEELIFASSSVVYGEETEIPTSEKHILEPISMYGATKSGGEKMCKVYAETFDLDLTIVRLANIVGCRNQKGVIYDFINKLQQNPEKLEILGNGKQKKSYLHIEDTTEAIIKAWKSKQTTFNIGSKDSIKVDKIAEIVTDEMALDPEITYTGGDRGWQGDVPEMRLDIQKLKNQGWSPENNSAESVRKTAKELLKQ